MRIWFHGVVHRLLLLRGCGRSVGVWCSYCDRPVDWYIFCYELVNCGGTYSIFRVVCRFVCVVYCQVVREFFEEVPVCDPDSSKTGNCAGSGVIGDLISH
jgi:hypothetical protein